MVAERPSQARKLVAWAVRAGVGVPSIAAKALLAALTDWSHCRLPSNESWCRSPRDRESIRWREAVTRVTDPRANSESISELKEECSASSRGPAWA